MFSKLDLLESIKARLGYPVIDLAITDDMIMKQIDFAIKRIVPYLNNMEFITVNSKTVKFEDNHLMMIVISILIKQLIKVFILLEIIVNSLIVPYGIIGVTPYSKI